MKIPVITLLLASSFLVACGGSSGSGKSKSSASLVPTSSAPASVAPVSSAPTSSASSSSAPSQELLQGKFIDAAVEHIRYTTTSRDALDLYTGEGGVFNYHAGDEVIFYLGEHILGRAAAKDIVTPLDLANTQDIENQMVVNIARLLQTLDSDLTTPGLQIAPLPENFPAIDFNVSPELFEQQAGVLALLEHLDDRPLVSVEEALEHLSESIDVPFSRTTLDCTSFAHFYCEDFSNNADGWTFKPETNNALKPDGNMEWVKIGGNGMIRHTAASKGGVVALADSAVMANVPSADYAVEARFRPRENGTTSNKQLYLLTRYVDGNNWYAGVLNVQNDPIATQVEIAKNVNGSISRFAQTKRAIHQGTRDQTDGVWYELRIESIDNTLTVYLDGEKIGTHTDTQSPFTEKGTIGIWTANKSFEFDDVRIVSVDQKPVALSIQPSVLTYNAEANDAPAVFTVNSTDSQGAAAEFTVTSSNPDIVGVSIDGSSVSLKPLAAGKATITFTSALDANRKRVIEAQIQPEFVQSPTVYNLDGKVIPAANATEVYTDQSLRLTFDNDVVLGSYGLVRIYDAADDSLVDTVSLLNEKDSLGGSAVGTSTRNINVKAIRAEGKHLLITPHSGVLKAGKTYWIAMGAGVIAENSIAGAAFDGIGKAAGWTFSTKVESVASGLTEVVVDDDGADAHFRSLQGALNYAMANTSVEVIHVKKGIYNEPLYLRNRNDLTIRGESRDDTIIRYENNNGLNSSTDGRALFLISGGDNISLENFTIHNSTLIGKGGQAETLYFNSDNGRLIAKQMNFLSEQDTILVKGWSWFYKSLIAGNVDFIWGYPKASLFEKSEIRTLGDSRGNGNGGYILQARVQQESDKGFVFLNSSLTHGVGPLGHSVSEGVTYLARSGGDSKVFDNIVFVNTKMDNHIAPRGWAGLGVANQPRQTPEVANANAGWREFGTMDKAGNSIDLSQREFMYEMTLADVAPYCSRAAVFSGYGNGAGWDPLPEDRSDCVDVNGVNPPSSSSSSSSSDDSSSSNSSEGQSSDSSSSSSSSSVGDGGSTSSDQSSSQSSMSNQVINFTTTPIPSEYLGTAGSNTNVLATSSPVALDFIKFYSKGDGNLRLNNANGVLSINYNGESFSPALTAGTAVAKGDDVSDRNLTRYVSVPVQISTPIQLSIDFVNASANKDESTPNGCEAGRIVLIDQRGLVLDSHSSCGQSTTTFTSRVTDTSVTEIFITMSRLGDGGGGIRIQEIRLEK